MMEETRKPERETSEVSANVIKHLEFFFKASSEDWQARKPCDKVCSLDSCGVGCPSDGWREGREVAKMKLMH